MPKTLAKAKCSYAFSCDEIGDGQEYSSMEDCMARITNDWAEDLNERDCPGGANEEALSHCIKQIEENDCNSTLDSIASFTACRASDICLD